MEQMSLRIAELRRSPGDTLIIVFDTEGNEQPGYLAGQFITLVFDLQGREVRRSYSLCSSPVTGEPLSIAIKRIENGEISRLLHHRTAVGDVLKALPPNGQFTYIPVPELQRTVFLFAAGVGITPLFSIIKTALATEEKSKLVLVYSSRSVDDTLFYDELNDLEARYPGRLKLIYVSSQSKNLMTARLNVFLIEKIVNEELEYSREEALFYTCGPIDYMVSCRITLLKLGFSINQIRRETFVLPEDEQDDDDTTEKAVKDTRTYTVQLKIRGEVYGIRVPYNRTILQVALDSGIDLPYSCRSGICSTCTATCTSGHVRMDYNEVLIDEEVAGGRVLVCTGHPTEDGTTIQW